MNIQVAHIKMKRASFTNVTDADDELAVEDPLEIKLQYVSLNNRIIQTISITMRTPGNDEELGIGFLFTEGIIQFKEQIESIEFSLEDSSVVISMKDDAIPFLQKAERNFYTSSSCGVCGKTSLNSLRTNTPFKNNGDTIQLDPALIFELEAELKKQQVIFKNTGGLHASALFDLKGKFIMLREDVGRHNALDKLIGASFLNDGLPLNDKILLLSGRASFELIQKASMAGIKIVAAVGAPSSLAVQMAKESGITLIGFLREKACNIYSGEERIITDLARI